MENKTSAMTAYYSDNNFDLIRLVAASQVFIGHAISHLNVDAPSWLGVILSPFPGVPAFFFVSGFLITAAWERNPKTLTFYKNRFYRIYPGLWVCVLLSLISVCIFYDFSVITSYLHQFIIWVIGQSTLVQFWTPEFLKGYGVGAVNGSLWTIPVELSFYLCVPIIYWVFSRFKIRKDIFLVVVIILSFGLSLFVRHFDTVIQVKLIKVSFLPWIYMFFLGALANQYIGKIHSIVAGRAHLFFLLFALVTALSFYINDGVFFGFGNYSGLLSYLSLCLLILSCAYTKTGLAKKLLRNNDYSYGIYIYHMPIINVLIATGIGGVFGFLIAFLSLCLCASASWFLIERTALRMKKHTIHAR